jgi:hypothetical protein
MAAPLYWAPDNNQTGPPEYPKAIIHHSARPLPLLPALSDKPVIQSRAEKPNDFPSGTKSLFNSRCSKDELDPALFDDHGLLFSEWIYRWVDMHKEKLDQAVATYEFCRKNPKNTLSVLQQLRRLPGGPQRIEKLKL